MGGRYLEVPPVRTWWGLGTLDRGVGTFGNPLPPVNRQAPVKIVPYCRTRTRSIKNK